MCQFTYILWIIFPFYGSRQTGALNRTIDRGSRAINFILTAAVFNVVPTILEVNSLNWEILQSFNFENSKFDGRWKNIVK